MHALRRLLCSVILVASCGAAASALPTDGIAADVSAFTRVATLVGPASPTQKVRLVVHLAYPDPAGVEAFARAVNDPGSPEYGAFLTPDRFAANFAPSSHGYSTVEYVLLGSGMQILDVYPNRKVIDVIATVAQADALFSTVIQTYSYHNVLSYANGKPASIPKALDGLIVAVAGFDDFARKTARPPAVARPQLGGGYAPVDIATAYDAPRRVDPRLDGRGTTIAIETAYDFLDSDVAAFWQAFGVRRSGGLARAFVDDPLHVGTVVPGQTMESTLDVEQTSAGAPGANIVVYEAADALNATFDDLYERTVIDPRIDIVSTSWGSCEIGDDRSELAADEDLFVQAAAEGQTRFAASGDNGSRDCAQNAPPYGLPGEPNPTNVDFPASSSYVAAVGGTTLELGPLRAWKAERAWSGSGGGASLAFAVPPYQQGIGTLANRTERNVPDVALDADPATPYAFAYGGSFATPVGGTSAAAPNAAVLFAQFAQHANHRLGLAQSSLYDGLRRGAYPGSGFHDTLFGGNGDFRASPGYDDVTGLGSLDAAAFMLGMPRTAAQTRL